MQQQRMTPSAPNLLPTANDGRPERRELYDYAFLLRKLRHHATHGDPQRRRVRRDGNAVQATGPQRPEPWHSI